MSRWLIECDAAAAASFLMSAAIGMTSALRQFWLAIGVMGMALVIL